MWLYKCANTMYALVTKLQHMFCRPPPLPKPSQHDRLVTRLAFLLYSLKWPHCQSLELQNCRNIRYLAWNSTTCPYIKSNSMLSQFFRSASVPSAVTLPPFCYEKPFTGSDVTSDKLYGEAGLEPSPRP
jgi:hypothetical protein